MSIALCGTESINGIPCKIVEATTRYGKIIMALAYERGSLPLRIQCERGRTDYIDSKKIIDLDLNIARRDEVPIILTGLRQTLDNVVLQQIGNLFVPSAGTLTSDYKYNDSFIILISFPFCEVRLTLGQVSTHLTYSKQTC